MKTGIATEIYKKTINYALQRISTSLDFSVFKKILNAKYFLAIILLLFIQPIFSYLPVLAAPMPAPTTEFLYGSALTCSTGMTPTNLANATDNTAGTWGDCSGTFSGAQVEVEYTAVTDLVSITTITGPVLLDISFSVAGFDAAKPDTVSIQVSNDDGVTWSADLAAFTTNQARQTLQFDVSALFTTAAEVNLARVRFAYARNGAGDTFVVELDDILLTVPGDAPAANTQPTVSITAPTTGSSFSMNSAVTFTGAATDAEDDNATLTAAISWTSDLDGAIGTGGSFSTSTLSVGTHTITASVTDSGGLSNNAVITVTITNASPVVTISAPATGLTFGEGATITFTGSATDTEDNNATLTSNLSWSSSQDGVIGSSGSFSTTTLSPGLHTITASVTDSGGALGSDSITLTIDAKPVVTISAPLNGSSFAQNASITFTGAVTDLEDNNATLTSNLSWSSDINGAIGTGGSFSTSTLNPGTHTITASVTDSFGNTGNASISITVDALPVVTITAPLTGTSFAQGSSIIFTGSATDNEDDNAALTSNLSWSSSINGVIGASGSFSTASLSPGVHTITASVTDSFGNSANDSISITVDGLPVVTITAPTDGSSFSQGNSIGFSGSATDNEDNDITLTAALSWSSSLDGVIGSGANFNYSALSVGTHTITASVTDSFGNNGSASISVSITVAGNTAPTVTITAPADASNHNYAASISFTGSATDAEDNNATLTAALSWSSDRDGVIGNGGSFSISTLSVGTHIITASVTDSGGLSDSAAITITVNATGAVPVVTISSPANGSNFTFGASVSFAGSVTDAEDDNAALTAALSWSSDRDGVIGSGGNFSTTSLSVGVHLITASVIDSGGQEGTDSISITLQVVGDNPPVVTITGPATGLTFRQGEFIIFKGTATDTEDDNTALTASLAWSSDVDGPIGTGGSFSTSTLSVGTHIITAEATDSGGNTSSDTITLTIDALPVVTITSPLNAATYNSGDTINFVATVTDVEDDDAALTASIAWTSNVNGSIGSGGSFSSTSLSAGVHTITASVTDSAGNVVNPTVSITIVDTPPVVTISSPSTGISVSAGTSLFFKATATDITDNNATLRANIQWTSSIDGFLNTGSQFYFIGLSLGTHTITAAVTDSGGNLASDSITVTITDGAPAISITNPENQSSIFSGTLVSLIGFATDPSDGNISTSISWTSSLDGALGTGDTINVILSDGTHTITASVTDSGANTVNTAIIVYVINQSPTISITSPSTGTKYDSAASVTLTGSASDPEDGSLSANINWYSNIDGGPLAGSPGGSITLTLTDGVHTITAEVTDSFGNVSNTTTWLVVGTYPTPHGGYSAATAECARCHRSHTAESPQLIASPLVDNAFCFSCHNGTGAPEPPVTSTHSNNAFGSATQEAFSLNCVQCHEPHGSSNLASIKPNMVVNYAPYTTVGTISFLNLTGVNSFDDGASPTNTRVCVACHENANRPGSGTALAHNGGLNHAGGGDYTTQDCTSCHPHSSDADRLTEDGFMPSGGTCLGCHNSAQDNGDGVPVGGRRQIVGAGGDFDDLRSDASARSHHVTTGPTDGDCVICHDQSAHQAGRVRLFNVDNQADVKVLDGVNDSNELEAFCLACHDGDATDRGLTDPTQPFSDLQTPPIVNSTVWTSASHNTSGSVATCDTCHDNGHGSNKRKLLAASNVIKDADPDDPWQEEERFCFSCHDTDGPASTNIQSIFAPATLWVALPAGENSNTNMNDRHDIAKTDQAVSGAVIECVNCHNPHAANNTNKLIADPDPSDGRVPGSGYFTQGNTTNFISDFCLDCHDGSYPPGVTGPTTAIVNIYGSWGPAGNTHGAASGGVGTLEAGFGYTIDSVVQCFDCHVQHVSGATPTSGNPNLFHLKVRVKTANGVTDIPTDVGGFIYEITNNSLKSPPVNGYDYCQTCHTGSMGDKKDNCFACHFHGLSGKW